MKRIIYIVILIIITSYSLTWAYPVINLRDEFKSLSIAHKGKSSPYRLQDYTNSDFFKEPIDTISQDSSSTRYELYVCYGEQGYFRLQDEKGNTLWKTSDLIECEPNYPEGGDIDEIPEGYQEGHEIKYIDIYDSGPHGVILQDPTDGQLVLKRIDGSEIRLPMLVKDFLDMYEIPEHYWLFLDYNYEGKILRLALVDYQNGNLVWNKDTDILFSGYSSIVHSENWDHILFEHRENGEDKVLLITKDGKLIKDYADSYWVDSEVINSKAPNYAVLENKSDSKCVVDLSNGEIKAEILCHCLDITAKDNELIGIASMGCNIVIINILSGELIQDFTDYNTAGQCQITAVKISPDGRDVWIREQNSSDQSLTKHYHRED